MKHTIISWDCCYRNFFHLFQGLDEQNYDKNEFEFLFIEQRSRKESDKYNHDHGLKSLADTYDLFKNKINVKLIYLDNEDHYHLGNSVNVGIENARGQYISVMDGDMLLTPGFLRDLDDFFSNGNKIANLFRHSASYPVGVKTFNDWKSASIDLRLCLGACPTKKNKIPKNVNNYGPLVAAEKQDWIKINGYDNHPIWSSSASRAHFDVNSRLETLNGVKSQYLRNSYAVHPWHPVGLAQKSRDSRLSSAAVMLDIQMKLIEASRDNHTYSWKNRQNLSNQYYSEKASLIATLREE